MDAQSLVVAAQMVQASNGNVNDNGGPRENVLDSGEKRRGTLGDVELPTPPSKK